MSSQPASSQSDAPDRDEEAVRQFIERFALVLTNAGMQRMGARVFVGIMASESGELTASELAGLLQVSPAAISGSVKYLEHIGLIERARKPGERRDHFKLLDDGWFEVYGRRNTIWDNMVNALDDGLGAVGTNTEAQARLAETQDFFRFAAKEFDSLLERWRAHRDEVRRADG
ncbi:MarR family protein [Herbihabitans rhizosphaerae]|uniref:MarR family protein n=1 Tax=Herbihabitans rhizosphaerae TaxID=1872711 RepID=A0A4Q7L6V3_9PSEU|nr:MarR family transcriptional regulator [Herbihabitans rhizosphaerae]RZS45006.1 MarR family protein [Herbihabitans rhizosphaerae]